MLLAHVSAAPGVDCAPKIVALGFDVAPQILTLEVYPPALGAQLLAQTPEGRADRDEHRDRGDDYGPRGRVHTCREG